MSSVENNQGKISGQKDLEFQIFRPPPEAVETVAKVVGVLQFILGKSVSKQEFYRLMTARVAGVPAPKPSDFKVDPEKGPKNGESTHTVVVKLPPSINAAIKITRDSTKKSYNSMMLDELTQMMIDSAPLMQSIEEFLKHNPEVQKFMQKYGNDLK